MSRISVIEKYYSLWKSYVHVNRQAFSKKLRAQGQVKFSLLGHLRLLTLLNKTWNKHHHPIELANAVILHIIIFWDHRFSRAHLCQDGTYFRKGVMPKTTKYFVLRYLSKQLRKISKVIRQRDNLKNYFKSIVFRLWHRQSSGLQAFIFRLSDYHKIKAQVIESILFSLLCFPFENFVYISKNS